MSKKNPNISQHHLMFLDLCSGKSSLSFIIYEFLASLAIKCKDDSEDGKGNSRPSDVLLIVSFRKVHMLLRFSTQKDGDDLKVQFHNPKTHGLFSE